MDPCLHPFPLNGTSRLRTCWGSETKVTLNSFSFLPNRPTSATTIIFTQSYCFAQTHAEWVLNEKQKPGELLQCIIYAVICSIYICGLLLVFIEAPLLVSKQSCKLTHCGLSFLIILSAGLIISKLRSVQERSWVDASCEIWWSTNNNTKCN